MFNPKRAGICTLIGKDNILNIHFMVDKPHFVIPYFLSNAFPKC